MAEITIAKTTALDTTLQVDSLSGSAFTNESGAHKFVISCTRNGSAVTLSGTVTGRFMRSDNTTVFLSGSISSGKAVVTLPGDCYNVAGRFQIAIFVTQNDSTTCVYAGVGNVSRTQSGTLIDSGEAVPSLEQFMQYIDDAVTAAQEASRVNIVQTQTPSAINITVTDRTGQQTTTTIANPTGIIAPSFDASQVYSEGDYVIYTDGNLYKLTADHESGTTWANTKKALVTVGSEIGDLEDAVLGHSFTVIPGKIVNKNYGTFTDDTSGSPSVVADIPVLGGLQIQLVFSAVPYAGVRGAAFYDAAGDFILGSGIGYTAGTTSYTATVPENAVTMAITVFGSSTYKILGTFEVPKIVSKLNSLGRFGNGIPLSSLEKTESAFVNGNSGTIASHNQYDVYAMNVYAGTVVKLTPGTTHSNAGYMIHDDDGAVVAKSPYSLTSTSTYEITVPDGGKILYFTAVKTITPKIDYLVSSNDMYLSLKAVGDDGEETDEPLKNLDGSPTYIRMFRKIGCIGDSLTAGTFDYNSPSTNSFVNREISYPAILSKLTGVEVMNLGYGGATAAHPVVSSQSEDRSWRGFVHGERDFPEENFTNTPCDAYIIALGTNDIIKRGSFDGDVPAAVENGYPAYPSDVTNSVGGYLEIIREIREGNTTYETSAIQPRAKIFLVTIPNGRNSPSTRAVANAKIKQIAERYGCYIIDLETYDIPDFVTYHKNSGHNNALGYAMRAKEYATYVDWIIAHNLNDFRDAGFIGTDYYYNP